MLATRLLKEKTAHALNHLDGCYHLIIHILISLSKRNFFTSLLYWLKVVQIVRTARPVPVFLGCVVGNSYMYLFLCLKEFFLQTIVHYKLGSGRVYRGRLFHRWIVCLWWYWVRRGCCLFPAFCGCVLMGNYA